MRGSKRLLVMPFVVMAAILPMLAATGAGNASAGPAARPCQAVRTFVPPAATDDPFGITNGRGGIWIATGDTIDRLHNGSFHAFTLDDPSTADAGWLAWDHKSPYIWFSDGGNSRIGTLSDRGVIKDYDIPAGSGGPGGAGSLVITKRFIWFTDQTNNRIGRFDRTSGAFTFYTVPTDNAEVLGMVRGHDGDLYFIERQAAKVGRLDPKTGKFREWALTSGAFPNRMAVDPSGNVWFTELIANLVGRIGPHGRLAQFHVSGGPVGLTYYHGALFTPLYKAGMLAEVDLRGNVVQRWTLPHAVGVLQVAARDHNVYVADHFANHVYRVNLACSG
jgi:streptogramin lyase